LLSAQDDARVIPIIAAPSCVFQTGSAGALLQQATPAANDTRISVLKELSRTQVSDEEIALIVKLLQQPDLQRRIDERQSSGGVTPSRHTSPSNAEPDQVQEQLPNGNLINPNSMDPVPPINSPDFVRGLPNRRMDFLPAQRDTFSDHGTYRSPCSLKSNLL
jgi:hypothetical protein